MATCPISRGENGVGARMGGMNWSSSQKALTLDGNRGFANSVIVEEVWRGFLNRMLLRI